MHLYRYRMDGTLVNQVTAGDWALASSGSEYWVRQAVQGIDKDGSWIYVTAMADSSIERHLYRVRPDGSGSRASRRSRAHIASRCRPTRGSCSTPFPTSATLPALTLHRASGEEVRVLAAASPGVARAVQRALPELLTIPAEDGFAMPAQVLKPAGFQPNRRYPVVLYTYGGPSAPTVATRGSRRGSTTSSSSTPDHRRVGRQPVGHRHQQAAREHNPETIGHPRNRGSGGGRANGSSCSRGWMGLAWACGAGAAAAR